MLFLRKFTPDWLCVVLPFVLKITSRSLVFYTTDEGPGGEIRFLIPDLPRQRQYIRR